MVIHSKIKDYTYVCGYVTCNAMGGACAFLSDQLIYFALRGEDYPNMRMSREAPVLSFFSFNFFVCVRIHSKMEDYPYVCGDGTCNVTGGACAFTPTKTPWAVGATVSAVANFTAGVFVDVGVSVNNNILCVYRWLLAGNYM